MNGNDELWGNSAASHEQPTPRTWKMINVGEVSEPMAAFLCYLISRGLVLWSRPISVDLQRHEALTFVKRLSSELSEERRARLPEEVKKQPPRLKSES